MKDVLALIGGGKLLVVRTEVPPRGLVIGVPLDLVIIRGEPRAICILRHDGKVERLSGRDGRRIIGGHGESCIRSGNRIAGDADIIIAVVDIQSILRPRAQQVQRIERLNHAAVGPGGPACSDLSRVDYDVERRGWIRSQQPNRAIERDRTRPGVG